MKDAEDAAPSKKRIAGTQLTKDNPGDDDDDDVPEAEMGTFKKATDEVLANRRIVRVRRHSQQATSSTLNPFAGIQLVPATDSGLKTTNSSVGSEAANEKVLLDDGGHSANQDIDGKDKGTDAGDLLNDGVCKVETEDQPYVSVAAVDNGDQGVDSVTAVDKKDAGHKGQPEKEGTIVNKEEESHKEDGDQAGRKVEEGTDKETEGTVPVANSESNREVKGQENQENVDKGKHAPSVPFSSFQQLSSSRNAFTGLAGTGFSSSSFSFGPTSTAGSLFSKSSEPTFALKGDNPLFSFGTGNSDNGTTAASLGSTANGEINKASLQEVPVETGEENEMSVFTADAILFEYIDSAWKERGKGELKVNISTTGNERARLVMRARGNYRLILNARLFPDMSLKNMEKKGVTFACMNTAGEGKDALTTFALKFRDSSAMEDFCESVTAHKGKKATALKTPENSP